MTSITPFEQIKDDLRSAIDILSNDSTPAQEAAVIRIERALRFADKLRPELTLDPEADPLVARIKSALLSNGTYGRHFEEYFPRFCREAELLLQAFSQTELLSISEVRVALEKPPGGSIGNRLKFFRSMDLLAEKNHASERNYRLGKFGRIILQGRTNQGTTISDASASGTRA